jgi:hypothetical protein
MKAQTPHRVSACGSLAKEQENAGVRDMVRLVEKLWSGIPAGTSGQLCHHFM